MSSYFCRTLLAALWPIMRKNNINVKLAHSVAHLYDKVTSADQINAYMGKLLRATISSPISHPPSSTVCQNDYYFSGWTRWWAEAVEVAAANFLCSCRKKLFEVYDTDSPSADVYQLKYYTCIEVSHMTRHSSKSNKVRNDNTISSKTGNVSMQKRKIYYVKTKVVALIMNFG